MSGIINAKSGIDRYWLENAFRECLKKYTNHMEKSMYLDFASFLLILFGALNWGLVGLFNIDLVKIIFGNMPLVTRIIYSLIGLSLAYSIMAKPKKTSV